MPATRLLPMKDLKIPSLQDIITQLNAEDTRRAGLTDGQRLEEDLRRDMLARLDPIDMIGQPAPNLTAAEKRQYRDLANQFKSRPESGHVP